MNRSGISAHLKPDEPAVKLVPTFSWWTEWNWCPPLAWWTRRGRRGGGWWERWSRPAGTRRTRPNVSTRPPFYCMLSETFFTNFLVFWMLHFFPLQEVHIEKLLQTTHPVFEKFSKQRRRKICISRNIRVSGYVSSKSKPIVGYFFVFLYKNMQVYCILRKMVDNSSKILFYFYCISA